MRRSFLPALLSLVALMGCGTNATDAIPSPTAAPTRNVATPMPQPTLARPTPTAYVSGLDVGCSGRFSDSPVASPSALPLPATATAVVGERSAAYDQAQQRWQAANIRNYRLTVNFITHYAGGGPRTVEVMNGVVVSKVPTAAAFDAVTVADLFAIARREIADPCRLLTILNFDATYGFPTQIRSDTIFLVADQTLSYVAYDFLPLP